MRHRAIPLVLTLAAALPALAATHARRLNRYEYTCTIRDLLGVDFRASDDFPADDFSYGFDNNADTLKVTPTLMAKYLEAARRIARAAIEPIPPPAAPELERRSNTSASPDFTWQRNFTWDGDYEFHIAIAGPATPLALYVAVDDSEPRRLFLSFDFEGRRYSDTRFNLTSGSHRLRVSVARVEAARQPYPEYVEIRGPGGIVLPAIPEGYRLTFSCGHPMGQHTPACVRDNLESLARRAWRRPVTSAEIDRLMRTVSAAQPGGNPEQQMETGLEAILVSPSFLFRIEGVISPREKDFELASRLSYFLWSSMPDPELFRAAGRGELDDPAALEAQARRMIADPKSFALAENFAAQWLEFRNLDAIRRDPSRFPQFTSDLRDAMRTETELFVDYVLKHDRGILDFLTAKYSFVNESLARLYAIPNLSGDRFREVDLAGTPRVGILTQASVLTVTAYPTRTSPVLRGKWILENILNEPPPPPPANVAALRDPSAESSLTLRQQLEEHRSNPACAGCHARMDPLGFGLENFDAIGRWRARDEALPLVPLDTTGTLPDGSSFSGPAELAAILARHPDAFARCLTEKLLTFALGRGLDSDDRALAARIGQSAAPNGYRFSDLILGIVKSGTFRTVKESHE